MPKILAVLLAAVCIATPAFAKEKHQHVAPIRQTREGERWAEKTLKKLSLEDKIGQVFMIWCRARFLNVESPEYLQFREAMQKYRVGSFAMSVPVDGPFLLRTEPYEVAELLNVTPRTLYRWELSRTGPPSIKVGRAAYYRREALDAWLLSLEGGSLLQPVAARQS